MVFQVLINFNDKKSKPLIVADSEEKFNKTTIGELKKIFKEKIPGAPDPDNVRVIFGKDPLEDNLTLSYYRIKHLSLLLIVMKMPGGGDPIMMFKLRLKEEFQCLSREILPGERQNLNDVFTEQHIIEKPDSHIRYDTQIMLKHMIEEENIRRVLLKGDAGTGKTVSVQKFILDWAEEKSNTHIDYIFPITFQKLNIISETVKKCSFLELLQQCFKNTEYLKLRDSDRILLIFDGLNEFNLPLNFQNTKRITDIKDPASVSDLLINLIKGNLLPNAQIWITSRPAAVNLIPDEFIDRVTEIQGFDDQQKEEYFRKSISDQSMRDRVISHMKTSLHINSMCSLPDYCRIISAVPEEMFRTGRADFPKTLTQMYSRLLLAQTKQIRERKETILALRRIAFDLLVNRNSLFSSEQSGIRDESVLIHSSIIKTAEDRSYHKSFCFVNHRTQEFLAALYVTEVINVNNPHRLRDLSSLGLDFGERCFTDYRVFENMMRRTSERQMDLFFCFLLGLTLESSQRALKDLLTLRSSSSFSQDTVQHIKKLIMNSSSNNTDKHSLLFDALKELDERYLIQEIKAQLKSGLSPAQISAQMDSQRSENMRVMKGNQGSSDSCTTGRMSCCIVTKDMNGRERTVCVDSEEELENMLVEEFRRRYDPENESEVRLIFNGKLLKDGRTLGSYGINSGSTIYIFYRLRGGGITKSV